MADTGRVFHFQTLDVYKCAAAFLPRAFALLPHADREVAQRLRRAALSIMLNIAEGTGRFENDQRKFLVIARGSALECGALLDAMRILGTNAPPSEIDEGNALLVRVVSMLTKMIR